MTPGERLKGTLVVLAWLALALGLREHWTADRPSPEGEAGRQVRAAAALDPAPSAPR